MNNGITLRMLRETMVDVDAIMRPWAAFIGLIDLRVSHYCPQGGIYAMNAQSAGFPDLGQSVVIHPETVPIMRDASHRSTKRIMSDAELAAWMYWLIHEAAKRR